MDIPGTGAERRQQKRRDLRTTAHVVVAGKQLVEVRTLDISSGGLGIAAALNPPAGATFHIRLHLPIRPGRRTAIEAQVEVTHSVYGSVERNFKIGLRFLNLDSETRSVITQFVEG